MFIAGMTRIWCKLDKPGTYWQSMPYAPRGYADNVRLVAQYRASYPGRYLYKITADNNLCRPV